MVDKNGAGIRHQGTNLIVRNCYFHDNEDGILGSPLADGSGSVLIDSTELANNGAGDGQSHNTYLNHYAEVTLTHSYSHGAKVGHLFKSRALKNSILYNRLTDEAGTTASYELDFPNGGVAFVIGNAIEQSAATGNGSVIAFGEEGGLGTPSQLFLVNNTIVNDRSAGTLAFVGGSVTLPVVLTSNVLSGNMAAPAGATTTGNCTAGSTDFVNPAAYDYHLAAGSACIDAAGNPGFGQGRDLTPTEQYVHPLAFEQRVTLGAALDVGAFEYGQAPAPGGGGVSVDGGIPPSADGGASSSTDGGPGSGLLAPNGCGCDASGSDGLCTLLACFLATKRRAGRR